MKPHTASALSPAAPLPLPPALATLDQRPSWLTSATGRSRAHAPKLDRAACLSVTASQLAKRVHPQDWKPVGKPVGPTQLNKHAGTRHAEREVPTAGHTSPANRRTPAAYHHGLPRAPWRNLRARAELRATVTLHAYDLEDLFARRPARPLAGDYRTARANAMRWPDQRNAGPKENAGKSENARNAGNAETAAATHPSAAACIHPPSAIAHPPFLDHGLPANPNRSGIKHLGLPRFWSQQITLEKHRHHPTLLYPYLICPATKQRCKTLLLPLATQAELRDAALAHAWLTTIYDPAPTHLRRQLQPHATRLIERYETLFPPRQLRSRESMRITYGEARRKT